jgi:uncharacterized repeat protein (TIGR01451 family)
MRLKKQIPIVPTDMSCILILKLKRVEQRMKRAIRVFVAVTLLASIAVPLLHLRSAYADNLLTEPLDGSTLSGSWLSGGDPTSACLTASNTSSGGIPGCDPSDPIDTNGNGALRLTSNASSQAGFVINQTPVSTTNGLQISFNMYQYDGTGADGIAFFLINGADSPTQPGAFGGGLGYSSDNVGDAGLVGGYVGVGFDVFGNFSNPAYGTGGPGAHANSITVRGSQATGYQFVTTTPAAYSLADNSATTRSAAMRHVIISISTNNIMTVYVDYENGQGPIEEVSDINLNTINGADSLPASLKFGFSASTGGSNDIHEISDLNVDTLSPNVSTTATQNGTLTQGQMGQYTLAVSNDAGAEPTTGNITVSDTLPAGMAPTSASGIGWSCTISGQTISCTRPGSGADALAPGGSEPSITVGVGVGYNATASLSNTSYATTTNNNSLEDAGSTNTFTITPANTTIDSNAPNGGDSTGDGTLDSQQANVTDLVSDITGNYATLETSGVCDQNEDASLSSVASNTKQDGAYTYPLGMMDFDVICSAVGGSATITQYYFGNYDASQFVARKYDVATETYSTIPNATISSVTIGGQPALKISYSVTDGGPLDEDGVANGVIVDPAGPAIKDAVPLTGDTLTDTGIDIMLSSGLAVLLITGAAMILWGTRKRAS